MTSLVHLEMIELPCLSELILADNLIQDLHPNTFAKLRKLKRLDMSINKLTSIPNVANLVNLEELMLRQNSIALIENLSQLTNLKVLNLSFNRLAKVEGIQNLKKLEVLELGKNYISDTDALQSNLNPLAYLSELYLYMNEIRNLPRAICFPMLKTLNINRNADLKTIDLKFCPMLDTLSASYCGISSLPSMVGCPNI